MHGNPSPSSNASPAFVSVPFSKKDIIAKYNDVQNKINELIDDKYSFIDENNILYNNHTKRMLNIKNIEINEIILENKENLLYNEIFKVIINKII